MLRSISSKHTVENEVLMLRAMPERAMQSDLDRIIVLYSNLLSPDLLPRRS